MCCCLREKEGEFVCVCVEALPFLCAFNSIHFSNDLSQPLYHCLKILRCASDAQLQNLVLRPRLAVSESCVDL